MSFQTDKPLPDNPEIRAQLSTIQALRKTPSPKTRRIIACHLGEAWVLLYITENNVICFASSARSEAQKTQKQKVRYFLSDLFPGAQVQCLTRFCQTPESGPWCVAAAGLLLEEESRISDTDFLSPIEDRLNTMSSEVRRWKQSEMLGEAPSLWAVPYAHMADTQSLETLLNAGDLLLLHARRMYTQEILDNAKAMYQFVLMQAKKNNPELANRSLEKLALLFRVYADPTQVYVSPHTFSPLPWQSYRETLKALRSDLNDDLEKKPIGGALSCITEFNQRLNAELLKPLFETCLGFMKRQKDHYAVLALGSLSREEQCPHSDLEFTLLIDEKQKDAQSQFLMSAALRLFELSLIALSESVENKHFETLKPLLEKHLHPGLQYDKGGNFPISSLVSTKVSAHDNPFWNTPHDIPCHLKKQGGDKMLVYLLSGARLLFATKPELYTGFSAGLSRFLNPNIRETLAKERLEDHYHDQELKLF